MSTDRKSRGLDAMEASLKDAKDFLARVERGDAADRTVLAGLPLNEYDGIVVGLGNAELNMAVVSHVKGAEGPAYNRPRRLGRALRFAGADAEYSTLSILKGMRPRGPGRPIP